MPRSITPCLAAVVLSLLLGCGANSASPPDLIKGITSGPIEVTLLSVETRKVDLAEVGLFMGQETTQDDYLCLTISITNHHAGRRFEYKGWGLAASLSDEHGNDYALITQKRHGRPKGQVTTRTINPGESVTDVVIFERPLDVAKSLTLSLPMGRIEGLKGVVSTVIPRDFKR